jgi:hypothetical protein
MRRPNKIVKHWTDREIARLKTLLVHGYTHPQIASLLGRTRESVAPKARELGYHNRCQVEAWTATQVARMLGYADERPVVRWIAIGWLPARNVRDGKSPLWIIQKPALYDFLCNDAYWFAWQPEKIVDSAMRRWTLEMRAGRPRWLTTREVAQRYCVELQTVLWWIKHGQLKATHHGFYYIRETDLDGFVPPCMREK